jgi:hypothetical protein
MTTLFLQREGGSAIKPQAVRAAIAGKTGRMFLISCDGRVAKNTPGMRIDARSSMR